MSGRGLMRDLPVAERPRERLLDQGSTALSDAELLAVLLRSGTPGKSANQLATEMLTEAGGLSGLARWGPRQVRRPGVGPAKAATVLAGIELGRRLARARLPRRRPLQRPYEVVSYLTLRYQRRDQEVVGALFLDGRHRLLGERELYRGTLREASAEPREVLKESLLRGAAAVVLFHTHPSGDAEPSAADLAFTRRLVEAGRVVGVELVDHLILGWDGSWISLREVQGW